MRLAAESFLSQARVEVELKRLAQFGADLVDAFSCFILFPNRLETLLNDNLREADDQNGARPALVLAAYHSNSKQVLEQACLSVDSGLFGWVSKNQRPLRVYPFDRDSRTLGVYAERENIKGIVALPIHLANYGQELGKHVGVLACDSLKDHELSAKQLQWLHELTLSIASTLRLLWDNNRAIEQAPSWTGFETKALRLIETLGVNCVDILRIRINNLDRIETQVGTARCVDLVDLFARLVSQALPPYCPSYRLPHGDTMIVLDNMLSTFIENKIKAVANHIAPLKERFELSFVRTPCLNNKGEAANLSHLLSKKGLALTLPKRGSKCVNAS